MGGDDLSVETGAAGFTPPSQAVPVKPKGIAILGSHPATVMQAPFDDNWLIYSCSPHNVEHRRLPRVDAWFEMHLPVFDATRAYAYLMHLENMPVVYMRDELAMQLRLPDGKPLFPTAVRYPEQQLKGTSEGRKLKMDGRRMIAEVPNNDGMFCPYMFTSSIAYMLAKAIVDCEGNGIKTIGLWGIMQASETEYTYQRPGIQYFIHEAMRRGIKVVAPPESCLFDMPQWKW